MKRRSTPIGSASVVSGSASPTGRTFHHAHTTRCTAIATRVSPSSPRRRSSRSAAAVLNVSPRLRLTAMLGGFVALTALGVWWAAPSRALIERSARELVALGPLDVVALAAIAAAVIAAEVYRLVVFGRVLGVPVGLRTAFDASMANNLFSWISPGGALGEPAAVYMMSRRGVPTDAALAIAF